MREQNGDRKAEDGAEGDGGEDELHAPFSIPCRRGRETEFIIVDDDRMEHSIIIIIYMT